MGFFDDIDIDVFNNDLIFEYTSLYGVYSLNAVKNSNDMIEYILNISHINEIFESFDNLSFNCIYAYLRKNDISSFNNDTFTYKIHTNSYKHIWYTIIPLYNTEIRLNVEFSENHILFEYFKNDTWWCLCGYISYKDISKDKVLLDIKQALLKEFYNITDFKSKYKDI